MAIKLSSTDIHLTSAVTNFPNRTEPFSLTCWLNSADWATGNPVSMVGLYHEGITAVQIGSRGANVIDVWSWGGGVSISSTGIYTPPVSTWIHVAYTWSGTVHTLYANANLIRTSNTAITPGVLNQVYINGFPSGGLSETSNTLVDDIAYFNRELTQQDIQTIYTLRGSRDGITSGLVARYCFDELYPSSNLVSVVDYSGNNNTLVSIGVGTPVAYVAGIINSTNRPVLG